MPWFLHVLTDWMIGVRATPGGLIIDPCLPSSWEKCSLVRKFRGADYGVTVHNPKHLQKGKAAIKFNGRCLENTILPIVPGKHVVDVMLEPNA